MQVGAVPARRPGPTTGRTSDRTPAWSVPGRSTRTGTATTWMAGLTGSLAGWSCGDCATTSTGDRWPPPSNDSASDPGGRASTSAPAVATCRWPWPRSSGRDGRVYAVDSDPMARDEVAEAAAAHSQVLAITQAGEDLRLPEPVDLAFCRFLLLHVVDPAVVLARMAAAVRPGGWVVAQEPITSAGRIDGDPFSMPDGPPSRHRRPAPLAGPRRRTDHRGRLGRGARRCRSGSGGRLPHGADRGRPRRRPGGAAPAGDGGGQAPAT